MCVKRLMETNATRSSYNGFLIVKSEREITSLSVGKKQSNPKMKKTKQILRKNSAQIYKLCWIWRSLRKRQGQIIKDTFSYCLSFYQIPLGLSHKESHHWLYGLLPWPTLMSRGEMSACGSLEVHCINWSRENLLPNLQLFCGCIP